ncbi:hypothetical protein AC1031_021996 [Aphanomyces cochlioides]|nr:hypothetical protein AC1031_021996 [Aphanomyces cochlioides]
MRRRKGQTLNLEVFSYQDFLDFLQWTVRNRKTIVGSTLSGYRSAMKNFYKDNNVKLPEGFDLDMRDVFSGINRSIANELQHGSKTDSGKRPLSYSKFLQLCDKSLLLNDGGFAHLFLTMTWNLMCRSQSTETIQLDHLSLEGDAIGVKFYKTKTKQEGTTIRDPRHCYANPFCPRSCIFVALGIYFACHTQLQHGNLFPGSKQKDRFGKAL